MPHIPWGKKLIFLPQKTPKRKKFRKLWHGRIRSTYSETFHMQFSNIYVKT